MRGIILAVLVVVVGSLATLVLERHMNEAPEWIWRTAYSVVALGGLTIILLTDPIFGWLSNFRSYPFTSICIVAVATAVLTGTLWCFFIIGFPTSHIYLSHKSNSETASNPQTASMPSPSSHQSPSAIADLRLYVIRFSYAYETQELVAKVMFSNSGNTRRTIVEAELNYRLDGETDTHPLGRSPDEILGNSQIPKQVEPSRHEVEIYKRKLAKTNIGVITNPNITFGLKITALLIDGTQNETIVELCRALDVTTLARKNTQSDPILPKNISLDVPGGKFPLAKPSSVEPPPTLSTNTQSTTTEKGQVVWDLRSFLSVNGRKLAPTDQRFWVTRFQASGRNTWSALITNMSAYVEIDRTGERFTVLLTGGKGGPIDVNKIDSIAGHTPLQLVSYFIHGDYVSWDGVEPHVFTHLYTPFTFVVSINGGEERRYPFSTEQCREQIQASIDGAMTD